MTIPHQPWFLAECLYLFAKSAEDCYWSEAESPGTFDDDEGARVVERRCAGEEVLMELFSPGPAALARKVLIALSDDRERGESWAETIVREARQMVC
jgi:hypothetical protein